MAAPRKRKTTAKTPVKRGKGELVPQPHGGALRRGGTNNGGPGRPPSVIRERLRGSFEARIAVLESIADGEAVERVRLPSGEESEMQKSAAVPDRLKAIDLLAKYGLGTTKEITVEHVRDRLQQTIALIGEMLPKEQADALLARLEPVWR